ncbi:M91 family zinc metallopeptidase [Corallococcus carmarthensis]|uniref:Alkaline phosphatase n=1 Tax=Corallococcus carmarthensis TaxID=2316728 RepID=A0A3A8JR34_9BACT|nr:M91 family zinc metallopeptidase [Corallococcus carmarthensis]NOK18823.1 alkaline phosphatase [Corallococcus carmarthensis]RKG98199.1 alkaline phosphatase [Corallococcus carmarthensis]
MSTIGKPGSRPASPVSSQPAKTPATPAKPNAVKAAVSQRMADGFESGPRTAARPQVLKEIRTTETALKKDKDGGGFLGGIGSSIGSAIDKIAKGVAKALAPQVTTNADGRTVVDLGAGNNSATVSQNKDGGLTIKSGSDTVTLTAEQAKGAIIQGGAGNDSITLDASVTQDLTLDGGEGDDKVTGGKGNDTLIGGKGNDTVIGGEGKDVLQGQDGDDYLEGGAGDDRILGGEGRDVLYGLDGNDYVSGGKGRDYIDGGAGDDRAFGGEGDDQVIGGRGNDTLSGGSGNDAVAGGAGKDTVRGGTGTDKLYVEEDEKTADAAEGEREIVDMTDADQRGSSVSVTGSAEFQARVQSDLDAMRSLPSGQDLLRSLDGSGKKTVIRETAQGNSAGGTNFNDGFMNADGTPGKGTDAQVNYNTTRISLGTEEWMNRPPVVGLFHELVHASDMNNGTLALGSKDGTRNLEPSAVGLPIDLDQDPSTPDVVQGGRPGENVLRDDLNLPTRPRY